MIHAQLDGNGVCTGYGDLTRIESRPNLVYLPNGWDEDFLWRKYVDGQWSAEKFEPEPPPYEKPLKETVEELQTENIRLREQVALFNNDFVAFTEFYFTNNPEQA